MKPFELKREDNQGIVTVFKGTEEECLNWVYGVIVKNRYKYTILTDFNMRPVFLCQSQFGSKRVFYLRSNENEKRK